ncbi:MAG: carotenoid biosynthesis protein, partial [Candidatus Nanopelagicales bacterium]
MSVRVYDGPHSVSGGNRSNWVRFVPWVFTGATIVGQILWILASGDFRTALTVITVTTFFLASVSHAFLLRGPAWTLSFFSITLAFGWLIEVLGTSTAFPFGDYTYADTLGANLLGVPILIP